MTFNAIVCMKTENGPFSYNWSYVNTTVITIFFGISTFHSGLILDLFQDTGQIYVFNDKFHTFVNAGANRSAWSFHTVYGMESGPISVFFICLREFYTCHSLIKGIFTSSPIVQVSGLYHLYTNCQNKYLIPVMNNDQR